MSTDPNGTYPADPTPAAEIPAAQPANPAPWAGEPGTPGEPGTVGAVDVLEGGEDNGFFAQHSGLITAVMAAIIVAAVAITGVFLWRNHMDDVNAKTEAAFSKSVEKQGASVDTVECDGGTCEAIIGGQAYSVLVQEDESGKQHFGVASYAGH